eukprot:403353992
MKLLSVDKKNYKDAPTEGIRRIIQEYTGQMINRSDKIPTSQIKSIRMGTTVATNALLERKGERVALLINEGLKDVISIGTQQRPKIFDLEIKKPDDIYEKVVEVKERIRPFKEFDQDNHDLKIVEGLNQEKFVVVHDLDVLHVEKQLRELKEIENFDCIAVVLMHSYGYSKHEEIIGEIAKRIGFGQISLSHQVMTRIKIVKRGSTCCVDSYLNPHIQKYLIEFQKGFDNELLNNAKVFFMQSDGGLAPIDSFSGSKAILSGPAGGVIGYSKTSTDFQIKELKLNEANLLPSIGFDMGGTSTDVSRYQDQYEHIFETTIAGISIQAPQLNINTVAAGGGSRLFFTNEMYRVGPESAGADPGPVCYRKHNGQLTVTDANLVLGRLIPDFFPKIFGAKEDEALDYEGSLKQFQLLTNEINQFQKQNNLPELQVQDVAIGFIRVANESMCRPIRQLTQARGYNPRDHILNIFGGAGGQHACALAKDLGIQRIFIHKYCGILSAYGLGLSDVVQESEEPFMAPYSTDILDQIHQKFDQISEQNSKILVKAGFQADKINHLKYLNLRYDGTDTSLMVQSTEGSNDFDKKFEEMHQREFGFMLQKRRILIDNVRVRSLGKSTIIEQSKILTREENEKVCDPISHSQVYFSIQNEVKVLRTPVYDLEQLKAADKIQGPAIILNKTSTILIEPECTSQIDDFGNIFIEVGDVSQKTQYKNLTSVNDVSLDIVELSIFGHRFMSIAEQMGLTLQRTSVSTNIKERLDFSCALFDPQGNLVANAPHLPVHLGSMQEAVRYQVNLLGEEWGEKDVIVTNHPKAGGTHLPDITVITPVFNQGKPVFYVASRGHHADIGGIQPGSMPSFSKTLDEEGAAIESFKLVQEGEFQEEGITNLLVNQKGSNPLITGTRNLADNLSDLKAQIAANQRGINLVQSLIEEYSLIYVQAYMKFIQENAESSVRSMLKELSISQGLKEIDTIQAIDYMDDGSMILLNLTIDRIKGEALFDFTGTDPETYGNCNAPRAIASSAIIYCLRCLVNSDIPLNQGCLNPINIILPENSLLNPSSKAAVVGGNVEVSSRLTDVILKAFKACAASQGTMNNLTFGDQTFGYYETIAGGSGAGPYWNGKHGVHTHMTNTRITDSEILELRYPVLLREFHFREGSGGKGKFNGGDGIIRDIEFLKNNIQVGILSERRTSAPYGLKGGQDGARGKNLIIYQDGMQQNLGPKNSITLQQGARIRIMTPGGGAYGKFE